jgi:hypothetical protein
MIVAILLIKRVRPPLEVAEAITFRKMSSWVKRILVHFIFYLAWKRVDIQSSSAKSLSHILQMIDNFSIHCDAAITNTKEDTKDIGL